MCVHYFSKRQACHCDVTQPMCVHYFSKRQACHCDVTQPMCVCIISASVRPVPDADSRGGHATRPIHHLQRQRPGLHWRRLHQQQRRQRQNCPSPTGRFETADGRRWQQYCHHTVVGVSFTAQWRNTEVRAVCMYNIIFAKT